MTLSAAADPFDPFDLSEPRYSASTNVTSLKAEDTASSTYGELVNAIHNCGSRILRYHDDYLQTRPSAPTEEASQYEFVSKGDYLCAGRDFTVYAGHLFKDYNASPSFPQKSREGRAYGDHKFVKPSSGTTASAGLFMSASRPPIRLAVAPKESVRFIHKIVHLPHDTPLCLREIISSMLHPDPKQRASLDEVADHLRTEIQQR